MHCLLATLHSKVTQTSLALHSLRACAQSECPNWRVSVWEGYTTQPLEEVLASIYELKPDLLALSCYIWNMEAHTRLIEGLRRILPDMQVLLGGHEVSHDAPRWLKNSLADYVIRGEGEMAFCRFLQALEESSELSEVPSLSYRDSQGRIHENQMALEIQPLDGLPSPFCRPEIYRSSFVYYEASRGCPYKCHFCLSALEKGARHYSLQRFEADMQQILARKSITQIKFVDRTFNLNKKRTRHIFEYLMQNGQGRNFHFEIAAELMDETTIELLRKAPPGMFQFEIGIQSIHKDVLDGNGRRCKFSKLEAALDQLLAKTNVHIHADLIAGLRGETPKRFQQSFDWVFQKRVHHFQIEVLKVLKGSISEMKAPEHQAVWLPFPPYTLLQSQEWTYTDLNQISEISAVLEMFYNRETLRELLHRIVHDTGFSAFQFFADFAQYVLKLHPSRSGLHLKNAYRLLFGFLEQNNLLQSKLHSLMTVSFLSKTRTRGALPFPRPSKVLSPSEFPRLQERRGFVECLDQRIEFAGQISHLWYFPAEPARPPLALNPS